MLVKTAAFGEQVVDPSTAIQFPQGLPGFEDCKQFKLFHQEGANPVVYWLQSLDRPEVMFSVADPAVFGINFNFVLTDEEDALIGPSSPGDILLLILLYRDENADEQGIPPVKGSFKSPLIINVKTLKGLQKVLGDIEPTITVREKTSSIEFKVH